MYTEIEFIWIWVVWLNVYLKMVYVQISLQQYEQEFSKQK